MMNASKKNVERRMRRLLGMSAEKRAEVEKAQGSQMWWARCWNCKKPTAAIRKELMGLHCPYCGMKLWERG